MKLILAGDGEHGKDEVAKRMTQRFGLKCTSSSAEANRRFIFGALQPIMSYKSEDECYSDRRNHRALWYELIRAYNTHDRARLGRDIFERSDVYVGIRDDEELRAIREAGLVDAVVWVDARERKEREAGSSISVGWKDADYVLNNNVPLDCIDREIDRLWHWLQDIARKVA